MAKPQGKEPGQGTSQLICHKRCYEWWGHCPVMPRFLFTQWGFSLRPPVLRSQLRVAFLSPSTRSLGARLLTMSSLFRELQDEDLQKFCSRLRKLLQKDPGPEATDTLQRLFFIVSATKYNRK